MIRVNDVDLAYHEWGSGDPPLLLLHGFTGSSLDWVDVVDQLATRRRVIAYDQRGHGESGHPAPDGYRFECLAADLAAVVETQGLAPFDLLGHSMGGIVAMQYALAHRDRLRSLILMDTAGAPAGMIGQAFIDAVLATAREHGMEKVADNMVRFLENQTPPARPAVVDRVRRKLTGMDVEAFAAFAAELNTYQSMLDELGKLDLTVTVIVGENDHGLRAGSDDLVAAIPGAELIVIPNAGHSPQEDNTPVWLAAVERHFERV